MRFSGPSLATHAGLGLVSLLCLLPAVPAHARPKLIFWFDSHPGMPPREEWKAGDTPQSLAREMHYTNMAARPGSPEHYRRLRAIGFDAVGLAGFEGPFRHFSGEVDEPWNLDHVMQTRNQRYYIPWARDAGLEVYLNIQFFRGEVASLFTWRDECWERVLGYVKALSLYARRNGCRGLIFDFEPYEPDFYREWNVPYWCAALKVDRQGFLDLLRQRGAEFGRAVAGKFPDCSLRVYGMSANSGGAEDARDVPAHFLAGLAAAKLPGGVEVDLPNTYYIYDPGWIGDIAGMDAAPLLERAAARSEAPDYVRDQCSLSLGSAAIHRWHSGDGMYDRGVARLTPERYEAHLVSLLRNCRRSVWVVGESSFDWTMPELSREVDDDPNHFWGLDIPFPDMSARNRALVDVFTRVAHLTDEALAARYDQAIDDAERALAESKRTIPAATVGYLHHREAYVEFDNDLDWRMRHVWQLRAYPKLDLESVTRDLPKLDAVVSVVSPIWADRADEQEIARPRPLPDPAAWRAFVERGGVLIAADFATNPNARGWLAAIAPELTVPGDLERCDPNRPAAGWNEGDPLVSRPARLRLCTCGHHLAWQAEPADAGGWVVLARCSHDRPIYVYRRLGKGLVAVLLSSKFQVGFGWEHVLNALRAAWG